MKAIVFENFKELTIKSLNVGIGNSKFYHRIATSFPLWIGGVNASEGDLINPRNDAIYPVFPSFKLNDLNLGGNYGVANSYSHPSTRTDMGEIYIVTKSGYVLGINTSGIVTNYGQPYNQESVYYDIVSFAGKVVFIFSSLNQYKNEDNSGSWTTFGSGILGGARYGEVFAKWLLIGDASASKIRYVRIFDNNFSQITPPFDIGDSLEIVDIRSVNDLYVIIPAKTFDNRASYVAFWDGTPGSSYIKMIQIAGRYVGSTNVGGTTYVVSFSTQNNCAYIYQVNGINLILRKEIQGISIGSGSEIKKASVSSIGNYVVFSASIQISDISSTPSLIFYDVLRDDVFLSVLGSGYSASGIVSGADNRIYLFTNTSSLLRYLRVGANILPEGLFSSTWNGVYNSNWIDSGEEIVINSIEVFYDEKPPSGCSVSLTLETKNEFSRQDYASESIGSITSSDQKHRKIFTKLGKRCSKFRIGLSIVHNGSNTWSGAVKKIIVYYDEVKKLT